MNFIREIQQCMECFDQGLVNSKRLNASDKPCIRFDIYDKWKPNVICTLFIAESPPWNEGQRYFYNPIENAKRTCLRNEVLSYLGLDTLQDFKKKSYFLTDVIKCRLNKSNERTVPLKVLRTCANRFLKKEIDSLQPKTIFVLGKPAKRALERFPEFRKLKEYKITDYFDENLAGFRVILCVYPGAKNRAYINKIKRSFDKILES